MTTNIEKYCYNCFIRNVYLFWPLNLPDGVTGNTSGFGPEESRFDP